MAYMFWFMNNNQPMLMTITKIGVRDLRVWNTPRSFTVTLSYRERDAKMLLPIVDYMTISLRQE